MARDFDPAKVTDRVSIAVDGDYFPAQYLYMIIIIRIMVGKLKKGWNFVYGILCLGKHSDYDCPFLIVTLMHATHSIEVLIYKPEIYLLAVWAAGQWYAVKDFKNHTTQEFPTAKKYSFDANYKGDVPSAVGYYHLLNAVKGLSRGGEHNETRSQFEILCVMLAEAVRFQRIFSGIMYSLIPRGGLYGVFTLTSQDAHLIRSWIKSCKIWKLFVEGYPYDPLVYFTPQPAPAPANADPDAPPQEGASDNTPTDTGIYSIHDCASELMVTKPIDLKVDMVKEMRSIRNLIARQEIARRESLTGRNFWALLGRLAIP